VGKGIVKIMKITVNFNENGALLNEIIEEVFKNYFIQVCKSA
jgi:hypothetical protein